MMDFMKEIDFSEWPILQQSAFLFRIAKKLEMMPPF